MNMKMIMIMNNKDNKYRPLLIVLLIFGLLCSNCKKEDRTDYLDGALPAPAQVTDIKIIPSPGGVILTYKIPKDANFHYAKAVCELKPGVVLEAKSSFYNDTLLLQGYGDTLQYDVKVYSVGKNEKASDPVTVHVQPLNPPVRTVFKTIQIIPTFGGVQVAFKNPSMANLAIVVMRDTTGLKTWSTLETFYTGADSGQFSIRGMESTTQNFAVFIRDRWYNKSDTLQKQLKPIFETLIPKANWAVLVLPGDQTELAASFYGLPNLWNGTFSWEGNDLPYASSNNSKLPQSFTIDLGAKVSLSRVVEHQVPHDHLYAGSAVKKLEIWASNNPAPDGSWNSWDSLGTFSSFKPSGLPVGQVTDEDTNYGSFIGEDFEFTSVLPGYRYIRWKTLETYGSTGQVVIGELDVFGQIVP